MFSKDATQKSLRYNDRPKLTEQKKPVQHIVPSPTKWSRSNEMTEKSTKAVIIVPSFDANKI